MSWYRWFYAELGFLREIETFSDVLQKNICIQLTYSGENFTISRSKRCYRRIFFIELETILMKLINNMQVRKRFWEEQFRGAEEESQKTVNGAGFIRLVRGLSGISDSAI